MLEYIGIGVIVLIGIVVLFASIKIVRQTDRAVIERFGKFKSYAEAGIHFIIPFIDQMYSTNITEQMVDVERQEVITKDNLNCMVDAQIYYKVQPDEASVKKSFYAVNDFEFQIVNLARTTLRDVIGNMTLTEANSQRNTINKKLREVLEEQADKWGVDVVRAELKEVIPPTSVQEVMNNVVVAERKKQAAIDFATATETEADGKRRAAIKSAEGTKQAMILEAQGNAQAILLNADAKAKQIKMVNESAKKYFTGNAQVLRKLEAVETSLASNTKVIVPNNQKLINLIDSFGGIKE